MKIFISVDMEGVNGIVSPEQVTPGSSDYQLGRKLVTDEVNAVIEGLKETKKVDYILVNDSHNNMRNIDITKLDPFAELITGDTKKYSMMEGLDETFDGGIFLGYHGKISTPMAIMEHSFYPKEILDIKINNKSYGEIGLNMLYATENNIPILMVTGDKAVGREVLELNPSCYTVVVKEAMGKFSAKCLPIKKSLKLIKEKTIEATNNMSKIDLIDAPKKPVLEIEFSGVNSADSVSIIPGTVRKGPRTVSIQCANIREAYLWRQVFCEMAS